MKFVTYFSGILISLIYLAIQSIFGPLSMNFDLAFSGILLFTLGLPHGAGDHLIAARLNKSENGNFQLSKFIISYIGVMALYGISWYYLPTISLLVFIGISVFHFGDIEQENTGEQNEHKFTYGIQILRSMVLGSGILGWILATHWTETKAILEDMHLVINIQLPPYAAEISLVFIIVCYQTKNSAYFIHTLITLLIGKYLPLYPAFMCYFGACHAVYSLKLMSKHLEIPIISLLYRLLPFSLLATMFGIGYVIIFQNQIIVTQLFIFLSLLTLPHFFLMHKMALLKPQG